MVPSPAFDGIGASEGTETLSLLHDTVGPLYQVKRGATVRTDGTLATKGFPNGETETVAYDAAKRPTSVSLSNGNTITQTYDRASNVLSEARTLTGPTGDAGSGTQSFAYDKQSRLTGSSGLSASTAYVYDNDGNRTSKTE